MIRNLPDKLTVTNPGSLPAAAVAMYTLDGTCVRQAESRKGGPAVISKNGLAAGTYLVKLSTSAGARVYRIVILR
jgi:hypothetical protein